MSDIETLKDLKPLLYEPGIIKNPFTAEYNRIIFADDVASGRPCKLVDEYIVKNIYPYYSNTHSNSSCGIMMKNRIKHTKDLIRQQFRLKPEHKIIFSGNGCTGAINHLVNKIDFNKHKNITIHITPFEHHSNYLPWVEKKKQYPNIKINFIECTDDFDLKVDDFIKVLDEKYLTDDKCTQTECKHDLNIVSFIACSNVTGRRYDLQCDKLWKYIRSKKENNDIYFLLDCACNAPYSELDLTRSDGIFLSGHKFLGGDCTPGLLIVNQKLLETKAPYNPGGGCVEKADSQCIVYKPDLESKEMGGTPNIVGIIRLGYVLIVKEAIKKERIFNENAIIEFTTKKMKELADIYPNFRVIALSSRKEDDLPIYPIVIEGLHYNLITVLFDNLFGIQTRGGISCCGMFGEMCENKMDIHGWCRISFSYLMTKEEIDKIFEALEFIINHGMKFKDFYKYDKKANLFSLKT